MYKDNLPYVFSVVFGDFVAFSVAWNWHSRLDIWGLQIRRPAAAQRLLSFPMFSHFHASLAT